MLNAFLITLFFSIHWKLLSNFTHGNEVVNALSFNAKLKQTIASNGRDIYWVYKREWRYLSREFIEPEMLSTGVFLCKCTLALKKQLYMSYCVTRKHARNHHFDFTMHQISFRKPTFLGHGLKICYKIKARKAGQYPIDGQSHEFFSKLEIYESLIAILVYRIQTSKRTL